MIDPETKEIMQTNIEASVGCLQIKAPHNNSQGGGIAMEGISEPKDESNIHPVGLESENVLKKCGGSQNYGYNRPFYQQEYLTWPSFYPDVQKLQQGQMNTHGNHFYPMCGDYPSPVENRIHYLPLKMFYEGYVHDVQCQEFQYFVVIDFEATCDKDTKPHPQEIIEFPSVLVNSMTGQLEASFQTYVRPAYHQHLTDFCKELTGIQQIQVDRGVPLSEALLMHDKWLEDKGIKHKNFAVVTWGNWDCRVMLESECRFKRIRKPPYFNRWINLKVPFQYMFGGARCNLKDAVQLAGLTWEGRPHSGLDDARNTARLLTLLMHQGFRFSITNSLVWQDNPLANQPFINNPIDTSLQSQKLKELAGFNIQHHPSYVNPTGREGCPYCFCGVMSSKCISREPGPMLGRYFFRCGNWTDPRRASCNYCVWASP